MKKFYLLLIALLPLMAWAQLLTWNLNGAAGNEATISASTHNANISNSALSRGAGVTASSLANAFSGSGWNVASAALAISGAKYYQFTVQPGTGYLVSISSLDAYFRRSGTGPNAFQWQYSLDGFATAGVDIGSPISYTLTTSNGDAQPTISLSGIAALQNIPATTTVTFRLYGWGATQAGGTFAIGRPSAAASLVLGGTVAQDAGNTPAISVAPTALTGFSTIAGNASSAQTVNAGGTNLSTDITVTPSGPYEISVDAGTTYTANPLTLTASGGTVANTAIQVRIAATAPAGAATGSLLFSSAGAATQTVTLSGNVSTSTVVDPPQALGANAVSATAIDISATANAANNNILLAVNSSASFGTPSGALIAGNTIAGGGTVLYNGPASGFPFSHTGLTPGTSYYYAAWSVDAGNNYSASAASSNATTNPPPAANVVINQVYGGGGNSGATYKNDFVELYNNENSPVNLAGWSLQYSAAAGTGTWQVHTLSGIIPAHSFFLVQEAAGSGGSVNLPTPDASGALTLSGTAGKLLLSNSSSAQTGANPSNALVMDKVGYGSNASGFETAPAPGTDNTTAIVRTADGVDNNNNASDFALAAPLPRNSSYTTTAPAVAALTPPNGAADVPYNIVPAINFSKKVVKGSGAITLFENGVALTTLDVNDASVVISNNNTVRLPFTLSSGKSYYIEVSAGAFKDVYNNAFAGISGSNAWAFTTYNTTNTVAIPVSFTFQQCTGNGLLPDGFTQYSVNGPQVWDCSAFGRDPAAPN
ncbi:MAG TPA: lamin tail domain-containing protein, partial [Chitinophagaceae bacterium]|nr:lamin tail domain-containing protein [Chitinophagaceae bacterium]